MSKILACFTALCLIINFTIPVTAHSLDTKPHLTIANQNDFYHSIDDFFSNVSDYKIYDKFGIECSNKFFL